MTDLLVKLYDLPDSFPPLADLVPADVIIRKPLGPERDIVVKWIRKNFEDAWASEMDVSFSRTPFSCYIAQREMQLLGFACYDSTALGYFGPTGVLEAHQGQGIGKALLFACLREMRIKGYGYAIVGWAGPIDFYKKHVGAIEIPDSTPGIYKDILFGDE